MNIKQIITTLGNQAGQSLSNTAAAGGQWLATNSLHVGATVNKLAGTAASLVSGYAGQYSTQTNNWMVNALISPNAFTSYVGSPLNRQLVFNYGAAQSTAHTLANLQSMRAFAVNVGQAATQFKTASIFAGPLLSFSDVLLTYRHQLTSLAFHQAFQNAGFQVAGGLLAGAGATVLAATLGAPVLLGVAGGAAVTWAAGNLGKTVSQALGPIVVPQVGGVLFENCDAVLTSIGEITGAYWDTHTGSLVLIGKEAATGKRLDFALPAMDADYLKVALRAALACQALGVSIDPPANYRYDEKADMPPDGSPLFVSYLGNTAGTMYGAIMFEADRVMKCLGIGQDNKTRKTVHSSVPGFRDLFEMARSKNLEGRKPWCRFWFEIDRVEIRHSPQNGSIAFADVRLKVDTKLETDPAVGQAVDQNDIDFAEHLTTHYDAYARQFPVFARLKELAKIAALAKFIVNHGLPIDFRGLLDSPPRPVATPETTPSILRHEVNQQQNFVLKMSGGVNLGKDPVVVEEAAGTVNPLYEAAKHARKDAIDEWRFQVGATPLKAKAISIGSGPFFQQEVTDHQFPTQPGQPPLSLRRMYNSNCLQSGEFGPGWSILIPFSIAVQIESGKVAAVLSDEEKARQSDGPRVLFLQEMATGKAHLYEVVSQSTGSDAVFGRVTSKINRTYNPADVIRAHGSGFSLHRGGITHLFDESGRLVEMRSGRDCTVRFVWQSGRLQRIENDAAHSYSFDYESLDDTRVKAVQISDGQIIQYRYDPAGLLKDVHCGQVVEGRYGYDLNSRLVEVRDASGTDVRRAAYDGSGRQMMNGTDKLELPDGATVERTIVSGRVTKLVDNQGSHADFLYGPQGGLDAVTVRNRSGHSWKFEYNGEGTLRRIVDPLKRTTEFSAVDGELITGAKFPDGRTVEAKRDGEGRLLEITNAGGQHWRARYGRNGRLDAFENQEGRGISLSYSGGGISKIRTPAGEVGFKARRAMAEWRTLGSSGSHRVQIRGESRTTESISAHGKRITTVFNGADNCTLISTEAGSVKVTPRQDNGTTAEVEFL